MLRRSTAIAKRRCAPYEARCTWQLQCSYVLQLARGAAVANFATWPRKEAGIAAARRPERRRGDLRAADLGDRTCRRAFARLFMREPFLIGAQGERQAWRGIRLESFSYGCVLTAGWHCLSLCCVRWSRSFFRRKLHRSPFGPARCEGEGRRELGQPCLRNPGRRSWRCFTDAHLGE